MSARNGMLVHRLGRIVLVPALVLGLATGTAHGAQVAADTAAASAPPDTVVRGVSPRGAMFRSFLVPGWGQAAVGSYVRGGVWFAVQGTSGYMLLRTLARLSQAEEIERRVVRVATDSLNELIAMDSVAAELLEDPEAFERAVDEAGGVATARKLVSARKQQRQDWITYTIFLTLMSGVDAYVNAHLHDFPTTIASEARRDGSVAFSLRVELPRWLGGTHRVRATGSSAAFPPRRW